MPITQSAKKAYRQSIRRRVRNLSNAKAVKSVVKSYRKLIGTSREEAVATLPQVYARIDKLAKTNYINKRKADRMKSRLAKRLAVKA